MQLPAFIIAVLEWFKKTDARLEEITQHLATERAKTLELTNELNTANAALAAAEKQLDESARLSLQVAKDHAAALEKLEADVERRAGLKAAEITARLGHAAVKDTATEAGDTSIDSLREQLGKEQDVNKRAEIARRLRTLRGDGDLLN